MAEDDTIEEGVFEQLVQKLTPCIERGDLDACVEEAARLAEEMGMGAPQLLDSAWKMRDNEKYKFAYVLALGAVDGLADYGKAIAYSCAGEAAESLENLSNAETNYRKAIESRPGFAIAHLIYANLLQKLNRNDEAESYYRIAIDKILKADPINAAAHSNYALLLKKIGRKNESEAQYLKSIEADPNLAVVHNNYANLLREYGKFSEAEAEVMRAFQIAQDDSSSQEILPYAHGTLGDILADEDYFKEAESEYQKALDKSNSMDDSAISEIRNNLGWVYTQMGNYDKAKKEFKKAHVLDPMNVRAKRNLRALTRIRCERGPDDMSVIQIFIGSLLLLSLAITYALFFIARLSELSFVAQSTIFLLLIFILFNIIQKFKFDKNGIEVERGTGHMDMLAKASRNDMKIEFEQSQRSSSTTSLSH